VLAYQRSHDDLVADGVAGPATLAGLGRDIAARKRARQVAGAVVGSTAAGAAGGTAEGGLPLVWAIGLGLLVLILLGGFFAFRYRGELRRLIFHIKKGA
jgi:lysozyme